MAIKRSPGCNCCGSTCLILSSGAEFIEGPASKPIGTSANNSMLTIDLDQVDPGSPSPGYNGDTIDLEIGADTLTFGIEDVRTYTAADPSACPPASEFTSFERRFYVTDGTDKFLLKTDTTVYQGENKADQDSVWTPLDFPVIKFRDGVVEVECQPEQFEGGYNIARTVTYATGGGGHGSWIPYSIDHNGDSLTLSQQDDLRIGSIRHEYISADCDCNCTPFRPDCQDAYTCSTVAPHSVVPYGHTLSIPSVSLSAFTQEQFWGCSSETTWGVTENLDMPDPLLYGIDKLSIDASYEHESIVAIFIDADSIFGGGCQEGFPLPGNVCTSIRNDLATCIGFPCGSPLSYTVETTINTLPQDGKWLSGGTSLYNDFVSLTCGDQTNCPTHEDSELVLTIYLGCPDSTLNPVANCDETDAPYTHLSTETDSCMEQRSSAFSGTFSVSSHAQRAETFIVSELDIAFSNELPDASLFWRGDRVYGDAEADLFGGGIWEKSQANVWVFKHQHYIPELAYDPDPSTILSDLISAMAGADQPYYYDAISGSGTTCSDWGGTPPAFTSEDWTGFSFGAVGPQTTFYTTSGNNVIRSAITGWCGSETLATDWIEWTVEKDCEIVLDWNHTQADQFFYFYVDGNPEDFSTYGYIGDGTTTLPCVEAGSVVRCEMWAGSTAATGIYLRAITVNEVEGSSLKRFKIDPDGTAPVEVTEDPHPWTKPEVQFGMGAKVTISRSDTDATSGSGNIIPPQYACSLPLGCDEPLPDGITDPADPTICGTYTKTEDFTTVPTTITEIGTDDGGWSDATAVCTVEPYIMETDSPASGQEWFTGATQVIYPINHFTTDPIGSGCNQVGWACTDGYTTTAGNLYTWEASGLWNREIEKASQTTVHQWWTVDATAMYGNITNAVIVVDFAKQWNDCWDGFDGPTVNFSGSELAYTHSTFDMLDSVSVNATAEVELSPGVYSRSQTTLVSRTTLNTSGITLTATPKASFPR